MHYGPGNWPTAAGYSNATAALATPARAPVGRRHALTHAGEECGIILPGRLRVTVGDHVAILRAGDAYYFNSNQPHNFHNPGNEPCELISACSPPTF
ncbi:MAG: cupin domain-containing protein [Proteobacteria bacterium]|nr:cupin domain-containing protein [Pseudomonadota bacterium]